MTLQELKTLRRTGQVNLVNRPGFAVSVVSERRSAANDPNAYAELERQLDAHQRSADAGIAAKRARSKVLNGSQATRTPEELRRKEAERIFVLNTCLENCEHRAVRRILLAARDGGYEFADCMDAIAAIYAEENSCVSQFRNAANPDKKPAKDNPYTDPETGQTGVGDPDEDVETFKKLLKKKKGNA